MSLDKTRLKKWDSFEKLVLTQSRLIREKATRSYLDLFVENVDPKMRLVRKNETRCYKCNWTGMMGSILKRDAIDTRLSDHDTFLNRYSDRYETKIRLQMEPSL